MRFDRVWARALERRAAAACGLLTLMLASCGGGGGSDPPAPPPLSISYSSSDVTFTAAKPTSAAPASQIVIGTLSGTANGTLYITVTINNPELVSIPTVGGITITSDTTGQARLVPMIPSTLGSGRHDGTIVVRACLNDPTCNTGQIVGSPKTINVHYDVGWLVERDTVTPRVVEAGKQGNVILRGRNFTSTTSVAFGATPAASTTFVSSTEIRASYPAALTAGTHTVMLSSGAVPFTGALVVAPPRDLTAAFAQYPTVSSTAPRTLEYDAERNAIFVGTTGFVGSMGTDQNLLRYDVETAQWSQPLAFADADLRQVRMSHDGSKLLVMTSQELPVLRTRMIELDPVTLAQTASTDLPTSLFIAGNHSVQYGQTFALANDGNAILTMKFPGSGATNPVLFGTARREYEVLLPTWNYWGAAASGDGSVVYLTMKGVSYDASTGLVRMPLGQANAAFDTPPSADMTGAKVQSGIGVFDADMTALGYVTTDHVAAVIDASGTRVYSLDLSGQIHTFDATQPATGSGMYPQLPEIGQPVALAGDVGPTLTPSSSMVLTPDGRALIVAGFKGIAIQPTPP